ncbi:MULTISPECIES: phage tail protein [Pseudomonas]|uniref:phage tail protein n=1 Tax=Pseudomonadaceae TaxID=135621 RepID=UPI00041147B4|nr:MULTISPECIES: phage tail protein [Pseudomonas]
MTNLTEKEQWEDGVYQIEKTDPVVGGPDGLSNRQGQQLANRTKYLKGLVDALLSGTKNAAIAARLATARAIGLTGDASGTANFDGSANASITVTLAKTGVAASTYGGVTVDEKGRVTAGAVVTPIANGGTGNSTGQAPSATKLATARTINGVAFDGTGNIAITDDSKAPLNSPVLTGDPRAPTPAAGDNDTSIATTAFVQAAIAALVNGSPEALNQLNELAAALGNNPNYATDMATALGLKANTESPTLTGTPKAPTAGIATNTTQIATTAFVQAVMAAYGLAGAAPVQNNAINLNDAPVGGMIRCEDVVTAGAALNWPVTGAADAARVAFEVFTHGQPGSGARLTQVATEIFGASGGRGRTFVRVRHDASWYPWREFAFADQLANVARTGKFSDLQDQTDHILKGTTTGNGWKLVTLQNLEAAGNLSLEYRNSAGITTLCYQGVNDGNGGWRPRWFFTPSGSATADRRAYFGGLNDQDQMEYVVKTRIRPGSSWVTDPSGASLCVQSDAGDGTGGLSVMSYAPTVAMLDRTGGAKSSRWKTDGNNLFLEWDNGDNGATWNPSLLSVTPGGEVRSLSSNSYRIVSGNYGTFWRNDGNYLWLMVTASADQYGGYNSLRPFSVRLDTGKVVVGNGIEMPSKARGDSTNDGANTAFVQDATGTRTAEVVFFPSSSAPAGFLKANGAAVSRSTYAALFAVIGTNFGAGDGSSTFNLPDLRGEFLRAWDDGRGVDGGRALNTSQASQNLNHTHSATAANAGAHQHTMSFKQDRAPEGAGNAVYGDEAYYSGEASQGTSTAGDHTHTITVSFSGGTESRPRNIALLACIKY